MKQIRPEQLTSIAAYHIIIDLLLVNIYDEAEKEESFLGHTD